MLLLGSHGVEIAISSVIQTYFQQYRLLAKAGFCETSLCEAGQSYNQITNLPAEAISLIHPLFLKSFVVILGSHGVEIATSLFIPILHSTIQAPRKDGLFETSLCEAHQAYHQIINLPADVISLIHALIPKSLVLILDSHGIEIAASLAIPTLHSIIQAPRKGGLL